GAPARSCPASGLRTIALFSKPVYAALLAQRARGEAEGGGGGVVATVRREGGGSDSGSRTALSAWRARREAAGGSRRLPRPAALRRLRSVPQDGVAVVVVGGGRSADSGSGAAGSEGRDEAGERRQRVAGGSRPAGDRERQRKRLLRGGGSPSVPPVLPLPAPRGSRGGSFPAPPPCPPPPPQPSRPRASPSLRPAPAPPPPSERRMMKLKSNQTRTYDGDGYKKRAACLCFRSESEEEVLLVSSSRHPDRWIVPGGGMEPEEEPNMAAVREVCEEAGVKGTLGRLVGIFENRDRKHRTYVYVLIVTEVLEDWEDSVNIGRKREWFKIEDAIKVLQYHKPVQASYFETLRQGCLANNGTPVMTTTYSESSVSDIR
uniref:diphosphoinositol-polyphosphate diphosphatase n=1 Tax=Apteryx owenii TaxID=8824 RepID=A0A8B9PB57_APTOW